MGSRSVYSPTHAAGSVGFTPAPGRIQTRFGDLEFAGGYPTDDTGLKV